MQTREQVRRRFSPSGEAALWDGLYSDTKDCFQYHMVLRRDYTFAHIVENHPRDTRILDLGCGAGVLTEKLLEAGYPVTGADMSADMLALARARCGRFADGQVAFHEADCLALPFADGSFDLVVSLGMFGYFPESEQALAEIRRVLRPGGTLILSVRNRLHATLTDPLAFVRHDLIGRVRRRLRRARNRADTAAPVTPPARKPFVIEMFERPGYLIDGVKRSGYQLRKFEGLGYGPFNLLPKRILPERAAIGASRALERLFRVTGLCCVTRWVADVSIYIFTKPEGAA